MSPNTPNMYKHQQLTCGRRHITESSQNQYVPLSKVCFGDEFTILEVVFLNSSIQDE